MREARTWRSSIASAAWPLRRSSTRRSPRRWRAFRSRSATVRWSKRCSVSSSTKATHTPIGPSVRLTDTQVEYALNDVRYLPEMYRRLTAQLADGGRTEWLSADFERLADPATYEIVPEEQWRKVKRISSLNRRQLAVAREVAAWRENQAISATCPSVGSSVTRASSRSRVGCPRLPRSSATFAASATRWEGRDSRFARRGYSRSRGFRRESAVTRETPAAARRRGWRGRPHDRARAAPSTRARCRDASARIEGRPRAARRWRTGRQPAARRVAQDRWWEASFSSCSRGGSR